MVAATIDSHTLDLSFIFKEEKEMSDAEWFFNLSVIVFGQAVERDDFWGQVIALAVSHRTMKLIREERGE